MVRRMRSITSTRNVPVPVAGSRICTNGSCGDTPAGGLRLLCRVSISFQVAANEVNYLNQKRPSARGGIKNLYERLLWRYTGRGPEALMPRQHIVPSCGE